MLSSKVETALNDQIAQENYASNSYLSMASWCDITGLRGAAEFFYAQSEEERVHMLKLLHYVNDSGGHAVVSAVKKAEVHYNSIKDVFDVSLEQEKSVTKSINKLVELTFSIKDHATYNFLQWYVAEQHEEENVFRTIIDIIKLGGNSAQNLLIIDNEIAKLNQVQE